MLDRTKLDFVVVTTPTASHAEIALAAAERGLHVFMEKPFGLDRAAGEPVVAAMQRRGLVSQVGYFMRFMPTFRRLKEVLDRGVIGQVVHYKNEMYGRTVLQTSKSSWRAEKKTGGGCLLDFGSHCLDLSDYLMGPVAAVSGAVLRQVYSTEVDDAVAATLLHRSGVSGTILVNWSDASYRRPYNVVEVFGTGGKLIADRQELRVYLRAPAADGSFPAGWSVQYLPELEKGVRFTIRGPEYSDQLDHFVECIQQKRTETTCTFADAWRTDGVVERIVADQATRTAK
jgi:predicted dehydrogenase